MGEGGAAPPGDAWRDVMSGATGPTKPRILLVAASPHRRACAAAALLLPHEARPRRRPGRPRRPARAGRVRGPGARTRCGAARRRPARLPAASPRAHAHSRSPPSRPAGATQRLTTNDALAYLREVKERFKDNKAVYDNFLEIMKQFKAQQCARRGVPAGPAPSRPPASLSPTRPPPGSTPTASSCR